MHKYFAKTRFLGKKITFLPECHSTSDELMGLMKKGHAAEGDIVYTNYQKKGKGQRGNVWLSEPGKNLLFSFLVAPDFLLPQQSYLLNIVTGLAVVHTLKPLLKEKSVELKWPNDVYVRDKKISGILIEAVMEKNLLQNAVIGVGLNINQQDFFLKTATSLYMETSKNWDREEILESFLVNFEQHYLNLKVDNSQQLLHEYYMVMRWRGEIRHFKSKGLEFSGEILGIDNFGRLVLKTGGETKRFDVKDIEFLY